MTLAGSDGTPTSADALAASLDAEYHAVYGYGLLGGRSTGTDITLAGHCYTEHEARRDTIARLIRDSGASVPEPASAYRPTEPVRTASELRSLAVALEDACAAAFAAMLATDLDRDTRVMAIGWLRDAAVRATQWRLRLGPSSVAAAPPLPGLASAVGIAR